MTDDEVAETYDKFGHIVLRRCRWILRDPTLADDALQEVFMRLWRYGDAFFAVEAKIPWLNRVAERCCFDLLARRNTRAESPLEESGPRGEVAAEADHSLEDRDLVQKVLARFDDETKQIAVMHYLDEQSYEEIGSVLGLSRQTVSKRLSLLLERAQKTRARLEHSKAMA